MNKLKLLLTVLMAAFLLFATQRVYFVKAEKVAGIYSDIIFTRLTVESQQYTRQIEYGLNNGKSLENFYNIQSILNDIKRCYSYIDGAYIISSDYMVLYSLADSEEQALSHVTVPSPETDAIYAVLDDSANSRYILSVPIYGNEDTISGYMVMTVEYAAVQNTLSEYDRENLIQAALISTLAFLGGSVFVIHFCKKRGKIVSQCTGVIGVAVCGAVFTDGAISVFKLLVRIESIIQQSVSKITMSLQNDLDTVHEKGAVLSKIFDLNSWLLGNCDDIPFIENLYFDKNYKITAIVSEEYIGEQILSYAVVILISVGICVAAGAILMLLAGLADSYLRRRTPGGKLLLQPVNPTKRKEKSKRENNLKKQHSSQS